jgi:hypothetical protein
VNAAGDSDPINRWRRSSGVPPILREPPASTFPMSDEERWSPHVPLPPRERPPRTELWTMVKGLELRRADLVERANNVAELQVFAADDHFLSGQRYDPRGLALLKAENVRSALEAAGWTCARCRGELWICEEHADRPFPHDGCVGPGVPCPSCNTSDPPRRPKDFVSHVKP